MNEEQNDQQSDRYIPFRNQDITYGDQVGADKIGGDKVGSDKITAGNISGSYAAIGAGAQVIATQVQQALSSVDEMEKSIQLAERQLASEIQKKIGRYTSLMAPDTVNERENPYKALLDYKLEDAPFFYGREEAIQTMLSRMKGDRLTVLHSESGSGKTSLLQAGLASRLLADGHFPLYLRPYQQRPDQFIKKAFLADYATQPELQRFRDDQMSLKGFLERVSHYLGKRQLFIFLDQFEEFFTEQELENQRTFAEQLQMCVESDLPVYWVLATRKEYFSDLRIFRTLKPFNNEYFLPTFNLEEAQEVITQPAVLKAVQYEANLVDNILSDIHQGNQGIPPAQVQLVCYTLFDELGDEANQKLITYALYNKPRGRGVGKSGAEGILTSHMTRVLDRELRGSERQIASRVLESLVTSDVRRAARSQEHLLHVLEPVEPEMLDNVLNILYDNRLVRRELDKDDQPVFELTHDYLLTEIELDPETKARKAAQELLAREVEAYCQFNTLLSKDRFDIIHSQRAYLKLDETSANLLKESEAAIVNQELERELEREREQQQRLRADEAEIAASRQRRLASGFGILVFLTLLVVGLSFQGSQKATDILNLTGELRVPGARVAASAQTNLLRMLAATRGYLALGDPQFKEEYEAAELAFEGDLQELRRLSSDIFPLTEYRLVKLEEAFVEWKPITQQLFDLRDDRFEREPAYELMMMDGSTLGGNILIETQMMIEKQALREATYNNIELLTDLANFNASFNGLLTGMQSYVTTQNRIFIQVYDVNLVSNEFAWDRLQDKRSRGLLTNDQTVLLDSIEYNRAAFLDLINKEVLPILESGRAREDLYLFSTEAVPINEQMLSLLDEIAADQQATLQQDLNSGRTSLNQVAQQTALFGLIALILTVVMLLFRGDLIGIIRRRSATPK